MHLLKEIYTCLNTESSIKDRTFIKSMFHAHAIIRRIFISNLKCLVYANSSMNFELPPDNK